jgi:deoxyribodipyrimidine photo-lyase
MKLNFETSYEVIQDLITCIDPVEYAKTRNYVNGAVTYLSPYISRGVISTNQVLEEVLKKGYALREMESFVKELCWRDYFQRVGQEKDLNSAIKQDQTTVLNSGIPVSILNATTGIAGVDQAIQHLYRTGYMHNHCRMYTASLVCNVAKSHWLNPAKWMYYHLLDGDWASNACSWQWVSGANSNKNYYANQENINKYTLTNQTDTFLDRSYESIESMEIPAQLAESEKLILEAPLPAGDLSTPELNRPTFIYNYYNLDPLWHRDEPGNRILLIEPDFFAAYPISKACMDFMLALGKNIPNLQVYVGSFETLATHIQPDTIYYKEHPLNKGYRGNQESRDWITQQVSGYFPSFFSYWKVVEKQIQLNYF